jgi:asparagine synthase (glutamine-hydrolysing)
VIGVVEFGDGLPEYTSGSKFDFSKSALTDDRSVVFDCLSSPVPCSQVRHFHANGEQLLVIFQGRLDNRHELLDQLGLAGTDIQESEILRAAWREWAHRLSEHLLGDWMFAIWDGATRQLIVSRDQIGTSAVYYHQNRERLVFAGSLNALLRMPGVPQSVNPTAVAQLAEGGKRDHLTFYNDVFHLTPGRSLTVTANVVRVDQYWDPDHIDNVRFKSDNEYVEAFLTLYDDAVRCRLASNGKTGILLSSGLDSTSTAALAAPELAHRGQPLHAFTLRPSLDVTESVSPNQLADETPLVQQVCEQIGNTKSVDVHSGEESLLSLIDQLLDITAEPGHPLAMFFWRLELLKVVRTHGVRTLLTGDLGNFTATFKGGRPEQLRSLICTGRLPEYWKSIKDWKSAQNATAWQVIRNQVVRPLIGDRFHRNDPSLPGLRSMVKPAFAAPLLQQYDMANRPLEKKRRDSSQPLAPIYNIVQSGSVSLAAVIGSGLGIDVRIPVMDRRIVEFCLGIPKEQYLLGGHDRMLIRRAMKDVLPDEVLWSKRRGRIAADTGHRICQSFAEFSATLDRFDNCAVICECLDLPTMRSVLERIPTHSSAGPRRDADIAYLMRGVTIGKFLLRF